VYPYPPDPHYPTELEKGGVAVFFPSPLRGEGSEEGQKTVQTPALP